MNSTRLFALMALIFTTAVLEGCQSGSKSAPTHVSGAEEMAGIVNVIERDNPAMFEAVMLSFVDCAIKNDVDGMVALTSKVTIAQLGAENLKKTYIRDTIPALRYFPTMAAGGRADYVNDGKGANGWMFRKVFASPEGRTANFQFVILKEQDTIRVGSFALWK